MPSSDDMDSIRYIHEYIDNRIEAKLNELGIPRLFKAGMVNATRVTNGHTFADVYINGSTVLSTNIPVNPDIAANVTANTPVWVIAINFNGLDLFVLARKLA